MLHLNFYPGILTFSHENVIFYGITKYVTFLCTLLVTKIYILWCDEICHVFCTKSGFRHEKLYIARLEYIIYKYLMYGILGLQNVDLITTECLDNYCFMKFHIHILFYSGIQKV